MYSWPLNNAGVRGTNILAVNIPHITVDSPIVPLSTRDWFQDPLQTPKSADTKVAYMRWCRTMRMVGITYPWIPKHRSKILFLIHSWLNPCMWNMGYRRLTVYYWKKFVCKRTRAVQTHVVQGSTVLACEVSFLNVNLMSFSSVKGIQTAVSNVNWLHSSRVICTVPEAFTEDGPRAHRATRLLSVWGKLANAAEVRLGFLRGLDTSARARLLPGHDFRL